jgi:hypothetical protein
VKQERDLAEIARFKERFKKLITEELKKKLTLGMTKPASIAIRELLKEREVLEDF